jgi:hypothetical protein
LKTNATQRFSLFKIQNLCYTFYSPPVWNTIFPQCGGRRAIGAFREPENGRRKIFIWIRRNPLKSPDSAKEMKGNESFFPWISLHFLARTRRCADRFRLAGSENGNAVSLTRLTKTPRPSGD